MSGTNQSDLAVVGHPSPARRSVNQIALVLALAAPPAAWIVQLLVAFAPTSYFCWFDAAAQPPAWLGAAITASNLIAIVVAVAALATSAWLVRRTVREHAGQPGGPLDAGEGRTRFLATWAAFAAALFTVAIVANTLALRMVTLCR